MNTAPSVLGMQNCSELTVTFDCVQIHMAGRYLASGSYKKITFRTSIACSCGVQFDSSHVKEKGKKQTKTKELVNSSGSSEV